MVPRISLVALLIAAVLALAAPAHATPSASLTRYPYLTDSIQTSVTVNWATTTAVTAGSVHWGPTGSCGANTTAATKTSISVNSVAEYQWKAVLPVSPDRSYCYRVLGGSTDLLGSDATPSFTSQVAKGSTSPFSFAVFGDWGQAYASSANTNQANVLKQISLSGARFAVMTGDTAYPGGDQKNYGDLKQTGTDVSAVFAPAFWGVPGRSIPVFNVTGNHGFTNGSYQVVNWPEGNAASSSGGRYAMEPYPSINGSTARSYPSFWYAFDAGKARFYVLTTAWADGNIGTGSVYANDAQAHWTPTSAEYQWLANDLATHPSALKFAFWHYPLYADSSGQPSDTYLQGGSGTLQGLLDRNNVNVVFNGHAHGYQRNKPDAAGLYSYVFGNGGAALGSVSGCSSFDLYAIGSGGSHCGAAPGGLSNDHVFGFAKVTVNGQQVTVTPTDELGRTYDVQTYTFPSSEPDSQAPTVPANLSATATAPNRIALSWSPSTDDTGVTGYRIYRDGVKLAEITGTGTTYADTTVSPATTYGYQVTAIDAAGNESAKQATPVQATTPGAADTQAPTAPADLTGTAVTSSQVQLRWTASSDDVGVTGYRVYRNGTLLASLPSGTTYTDEAAPSGTTATYGVSALDAAGNESARSTVSVTVPGAAGGGTLTFAPTDDATLDASNPSAALGTGNRLTVDASPVNDFLVRFDVSGTGSGTSCPTIAAAKLRLTVGSTSNDNSAKGGDFRAAASSNWSEASVTYANAPAATGSPVASIATSVALSTAYLVDVTPLVTGNGPVTIRASSTSSDGARYFSRNGNPASQAPELQITCGGGTGGGGGTDATPPTAPGTPAAGAVTANSVALSWAASTDDTGVAGYRVMRDGVQIATTGGAVTSYQDSGLSPSTTYSYTVTAFDAAGNVSAASGSRSVTTSSSAMGGQLTFAATDDATIDASAPSSALGTGSRLTVDASPVNDFLVKFTVSGTGAGTSCPSIAAAKLRLTVGTTSNDNSTKGGDFRAAVSSSWSQASVTWANAPAAASGAPVASLSSSVALGTAYLVDVTPIITGNGTFTIRASTTSSDGARYFSRDGNPASQAPELQITCA